MVEFSRTDGFLELDQRRQRHHHITSAAHEQPLDVVGRGTSTGRDLYQYVVLLRVALVPRHGASAQHGLHHPGHLVHTHARIRRSFAVHLQEDLRFVQAQVDVWRHEARVLRHLGQEGLGHAGQVLVAVVGHHDKVHRSLTEALTQTRGRDREGHHPRQTAHLALQFPGNLQGGLVPLVPIDGPQDG